MNPSGRQETITACAENDGDGKPFILKLREPIMSLVVAGSSEACERDETTSFSTSALLYVINMMTRSELQENHRLTSLPICRLMIYN